MIWKAMRWRKRSFIHWFMPQMLQQPELGQVESIRLELSPVHPYVWQGLSAWAISCCLPGCAFAESWNCEQRWDFNLGFHRGFRCCRKLLNHCAKGLLHLLCKFWCMTYANWTTLDFWFSLRFFKIEIYFLWIIMCCL